MFDVTIFGALIAGLLSFLSPCILPIVPFYLSYLAGVGMNQISAEAVITRSVRVRAFIAACCFALGVITVFVGLGATATAFGSLVREYFDVLRWFAAAIIIAMGLHFLGIIRIGLLYRQLRAEAGDTSNVGLARRIRHRPRLRLRLDPMRWPGPRCDPVHRGRARDGAAGSGPALRSRRSPRPTSAC